MHTKYEVSIFQGSEVMDKVKKFPHTYKLKPRCTTKSMPGIYYILVSVHLQILTYDK